MIHDTDFHFLVGPLCPEVTVRENTYTSPLSAPVCLGDYLYHPNIHPFFASHHVMGSRFPEDTTPDLISPEGLSLNLKQGLSIQTVLNQALAKHPVDVLIWWGLENGIPPDLERLTLPKVLVVSDWHFHYLALLPILSSFDLILCDEKLREKIETLDINRPVLYWPAYSFSPELIPKASDVRDIDVLFVGNHNPHKYIVRNQYLMRLAKLYNLHYVIRSDLPHAVYLKLLSRSKIAFNHSLRQEMNLRSYEASACGAMLLIEEDNKEIDYFLKRNHSYVAYNSENFEQQVLYYLQHPKTREQIALNAHKKIQQHDYTQQFKQLIQQVSQFLTERQNLAKQQNEQQMLPNDHKSAVFIQKLAQVALKLTTDVPVLRRSSIGSLEQLYLVTSEQDKQAQILNALLVAHNDTALYLPDHSLSQAEQCAQKLIQTIKVLSKQDISSLWYYNLAWHFFFHNNLQACGFWLEQHHQAVKNRPLSDALFLLPMRYTGLHLAYQQAAYQGIQALQKVIDAGSLFLMGYILLSQKEFRQASTVFDHCVECVPQFIEAYFENAQIAHNEHHHQIAQSYLARGLKHGIFYPGAWLRYLQLYPDNPAASQAKAQTIRYLLRLFQDDKYEGFQSLLKQELKATLHL